MEDNDYVFTGLNASTTYRIRITTVAVGHPLRHSAVVSVKTQAAPAAAASSTTAPQVLKPEVPQLTKPGKPVARLDNRTSTELTFDFPASQLTAKDGALFNSAMSSMYTVEYKAEYGYSSMLSFLR